MLLGGLPRKETWQWAQGLQSFLRAEAVPQCSKIPDEIPLTSARHCKGPGRLESVLKTEDF